MKRAFKFLFLPYQKKKLFSQSLFLVLVIRLSLWFFPYKNLVAWLAYLSPVELKDQEPDWEKIKEVTRAVRLCSRYIPSASCLTQALALQTLLRRNGEDTELKFGVKIDSDKKFSAHAWLEKNGKIIIGRLVDHQEYSNLKHSNYVVL